MGAYKIPFKEVIIGYVVVEARSKKAVLDCDWDYELERVEQTKKQVYYEGKAERTLD